GPASCTPRPAGRQRKTVAAHRSPPGMLKVQPRGGAEGGDGGMDLDLMDLGFRVERTFRVRIDWCELLPEAGELTAGDLFAHVLDRLGPNDNPVRVGDVLL